MQSLMGQIGQQAGLIQRLPGMKQLAMANRLRDAVKTGGLEFNPMMANLADTLLGLGRAAEAERLRLAREAAARDSADRANRARAAALDAARAALAAAVYFDYDMAEIRADARTTLESKLPILTANPGIRLRIEGHTDSRGSDEYNLALGSRRAASTKAFLTERGIDGSRIEIVSFGKERPTCTEEEEACWSRNRRAEFRVTAGGDQIMLPNVR